MAITPEYLAHREAMGPTIPTQTRLPIPVRERVEREALALRRTVSDLVREAVEAKYAEKEAT
jgi:predicted DNA-binding protein